MHIKKNRFERYRLTIFLSFAMAIILYVFQISSPLRNTVSSQDGSIIYSRRFGNDELYAMIDETVISIELPETMCSVEAIHTYSDTSFFLCTKEWHISDTSFPHKDIIIYKYSLNSNTDEFRYIRYYSLSNVNDKILSFLVLDELEHRLSLITEKELNYYLGSVWINKQYYNRKFIDQCVVGDNLVVLMYDLDSTGKPIGSRLIKITQYPFIEQIYQKHGILIDEMFTLNASELVLIDQNSQNYNLTVY